MITEVGILTSDLERSIAFWEACLDSPPFPGAVSEPLPPEVVSLLAEQGLTALGSVVLPASAARGRVRLIETDGVSVCARSTARCPHGWRAIEVIVRDLDRTFARASELASEVLGLPRWLGDDPGVGIRAGQLLSFGGEVVYLTELDRSIVTLDLPEEGEVGSVFIMVVGTTDIDATVEHYSQARYSLLGRSAPIISSLNLLQGTPDRETPSAFISAGTGSYFEVNEYVVAAQSELSDAATLSPIAYVRLSEHCSAGDEREAPTTSPTPLFRRIGPNSEVFLIDGHTHTSANSISHSQ